MILRIEQGHVYPVELPILPSSGKRIHSDSLFFSIAGGTRK
jgi:hypothetical protein